MAVVFMHLDVGTLSFVTVFVMALLGALLVFAGTGSFIVPGRGFIQTKRYLSPARIVFDIFHRKRDSSRQPATKAATRVLTSMREVTDISILEQ